MKKITTYVTLCLIAILLLPSCRSKMGMMKRHYSKGYYVSHSKGKNKTTIARTEAKPIEVDKMASINVLSKKENVNGIKDQPSPKQSESIMASAYPAKNGNVEPVNKITYKSINVTKPAKEVKKTISQISMNHGEGDGLSLFWLVILVILILWLFGFLLGGFGLGGLINLLLVIALILLILWLLRIV
jgi:hypothetical protein